MRKGNKNTSPFYESMEIKGDSVIIHYEKGTDDLVTKDKYGYTSGFLVAGGDKRFHWAKLTSVIIRLLSMVRTFRKTFSCSLCMVG